jgi:hypothetical protein
LEKPAESSEKPAAEPKVKQTKKAVTLFEFTSGSATPAPVGSNNFRDNRRNNQRGGNGRSTRVNVHDVEAFPSLK